ncbi:hypothetical protein [Streptomyces sp. NPDC020996]|uniref:hypothetical protein n=1 Tax=Streptomyces sp. NPDC020996 TaxID=3154791 RepID=UPI0034065409
MTATDAASAVRTASAPDVSSRRARWPLFGVAAGLLGAVATLVTDIHPEGYPEGFTPKVISDVSQTKAHISIVAGFLVVALLLVLAGAWRRRVEPQVPGSTAAHVVSGALTASAAALTLGYGWKGALAVYLPGGMDAGAFDRAGLYVLFMLNDFGSFIGWLGVVVAAGAIAWMALRERTVSRWIGAVSVLPVLVVTGFVSATGLPGFQGIVGPLWLAVAFLGLSFGRSPIVR